MSGLIDRLRGIKASAPQPPAPTAAAAPTPAAAGAALSALAAKQRRAERSAWVKAHIAVMQADIARMRAARGLPLFTGDQNQ